MLNVVVTETPPKLEPVTDDPFDSVAVSDAARETTARRIAELFGSEHHRAIVD